MPPSSAPYCQRSNVRRADLVTEAAIRSVYRTALTTVFDRTAGANVTRHDGGQVLSNATITKLQGGVWTIGAGGDGDAKTINLIRDVAVPIMSKHDGVHAVKVLDLGVQRSAIELLCDPAILDSCLPHVRAAFAITGDDPAGVVGSVNSFMSAVLKRAKLLGKMPNSPGADTLKSDLMQAVADGWKEAGEARGWWRRGRRQS